MAEESFEIISLQMSGKLFFTLLFKRLFSGMIVPLLTFVTVQFYKPKKSVRKFLYFVAENIVLVGIFFIRRTGIIRRLTFFKKFSRTYLFITLTHWIRMVSDYKCIAGSTIFNIGLPLWSIPPCNNTPAEHGDEFYLKL